MKKWLKKNKKTILKTLLIIAIIGAIAGTTYGILYACGFTSVDKFKELKEKLGDNLGFWSIIVLLQIIQSVFIPISNSLISFPVSMIFNNEIWKVFLSSFIGIFIGNVILYYIGRFGSGKLLKFVIGDQEKADKFKIFMQSSKSFYLIAGICPIIPSDVCNVLAGIAKYDALFVIISTFITRAICVSTTCYLAGYITRYPWVIAILVVLLVGMCVLAYFTTKKALQRNKENTTQENTTHVRKNTKM